MFELVKSILSVLGLFIIIALLWQWAEKIFYGQITPRKIDDYVAFILAISLYFNMK
jgi:di/tricarboxylate transporter